MNPAYSVIFFSTLSGAGYGLLYWCAVAALMRPATTSLSALTCAAVLIVTGLLSSTAHLGHPERAWRAFSQWRTSWLSREGVAAMLTFIPMLALGAGLHMNIGWMTRGAAGLAMLGALITVYCTAMIYASLKTIPQWNQRSVPLIYLLYSLASGAMLAATFGLMGSALMALLAVCLWGASWLAKLSFWNRTTTLRGPDLVEALGLPEYRGGRILDQAHTQMNFVQREMGYRVARKHATKLRGIALLLALLSGGGCLITVKAGVAWGVWMALPTMLGALIIERWLFFAEARHVANLYYSGS